MCAHAYQFELAVRPMVEQHVGQRAAVEVVELAVGPPLEVRRAVLELCLRGEHREHEAEADEHDDAEPHELPQRKRARRWREPAHPMRRAAPHTPTPPPPLTAPHMTEIE